MVQHLLIYHYWYEYVYSIAGGLSTIASHVNFRVAITRFIMGQAVTQRHSGHVRISAPAPWGCAPTAPWGLASRLVGCQGGWFLNRIWLWINDVGLVDIILTVNQCVLLLNHIVKEHHWFTRGRRTRTMRWSVCILSARSWLIPQQPSQFRSSKVAKRRAQNGLSTPWFWCFRRYHPCFRFHQTLGACGWSAMTYSLLIHRQRN